MNRIRIKPFAAFALLLLAACAPVVPVKDDRIPGARVADYRGGPAARNESLNGWSFVIDPGHGGAERGAPSAVPGNSSEADDNLAVGLLLGGMLEASGAQVAYTRTADVQVSDPGAPLKQELTSRSALANRLDPDFFISIHHNGSEKPEHDGIEVYYKLFSSGPAQSLAEDVARELSRLYPDFDSQVLAGNFAVLRNCAGEAVLVECSYMSDRRLAPELEKLRLLKKEAAAVYEGIRRYAKRSQPAIRVDRDSSGLDVTVKSHRPLRSVNVMNNAGTERKFPTADTAFQLQVTGEPFVIVTVEDGDGRLTMKHTLPMPRQESGTVVAILQTQSRSPIDEIVRVDDGLALALMPPARSLNDALFAIESSPPDYTVVLLDAPGKVITHYFRSPTGEKLARALARALPGYTVRSGAGYLLNHTSMPTVTVTMPRLDEPTLERLKRALRDFVR